MWKLADCAVDQTEPLHLLHRHLQPEDLQVRIHLKDNQSKEDSGDQIIITNIHLEGEACTLTNNFSILFCVNHNPKIYKISPLGRLER